VTVTVAPPSGTAWWRVVRVERGVFADGFAGSLVGGALAVPLIVRAVAGPQRVRVAVAITAVAVLVLLYVGFIAFAVVVLGWD
jgi:hypothetical protein